MFRFKKRTNHPKHPRHPRHPKPPLILPIEYTGYHWPEREDDKDPIVLPDDLLSMIKSSSREDESPDTTS